MRIETLCCSNGHRLDYMVDDECQGGIMPCANLDCDEMVGWKRAKQAKQGLDKLEPA